MFEQLSESKARRLRTRGQIILSAIVHGAAISGGILVSRSTLEATRPLSADTTLLWIPRPEHRPEGVAPQEASVTIDLPPSFRPVVDTTGHVEPASWRVLRSSDPRFEAPAREAAMKTLFTPARIKGRSNSWFSDDSDSG